MWKGQGNPSSPDHLAKALLSPLYVSAEGNVSPRIPQRRRGSIFLFYEGQVLPISTWASQIITSIIGKPKFQQFEKNRNK